MAHIYSMTGFGKASVQLSGKKITCEVKSLNSKQTDLNLRMPSAYREKEGELRKLAAEQLERGKIDVSIYSEVTGADKAPEINMALAEHYLNQLQQLAAKSDLSGDFIGTLMRMPDILHTPSEEIDDAEWTALLECVQGALDKLKEHRAAEGLALVEDLSMRLNEIDDRQQALPEYEEERIGRIKDKLTRALAELKADPDQNRYEQELIFYLEKLDITEEKVRLTAHLNYFRSLLAEGGPVGKKLGFVSQEIGREINTMGSKANHAGMQKLVVEMKDELEKIKEQVLNIL
jgi:uncharacterized protein (TIGR00255 family)